MNTQKITKYIQSPNSKKWIAKKKTVGAIQTTINENTSIFLMREGIKITTYVEDIESLAVGVEYRWKV